MNNLPSAGRSRSPRGVTEHGLSATLGLSREVVFITAPSALRVAKAIAGPESATVSWVASESNGGIPDVRYRIKGRRTASQTAMRLGESRGSHIAE